MQVQRTMKSYEDTNLLEKQGKKTAEEDGWTAVKCKRNRTKHTANPYDPTNDETLQKCLAAYYSDQELQGLPFAEHLSARITNANNLRLSGKIASRKLTGELNNVLSEKQHSEINEKIHDLADFFLDLRDSERDSYINAMNSEERRALSVILNEDEQSQKKSFMS